MSPRLAAQARPETGGQGVFALETVPAGEILAVWGGQVVNEQELLTLPHTAQIHAVQIDEGLYLAPYGPPEPADYFNHSCAPNAGLRGQVTLVAMREIQPGEEVCFDYAMSDSGDYDQFDCACGAPTCRGKITGDGWKDPILWQKYQGYFSPYLQHRIDLLKTRRER